ncbi:TauD/TfdA family dioxygenase [Frankia sp. AgPm24]|uniref:TauD/TfdA family dioxygenase n=1 Tax=Frankia sp. AgPm24 TaxID=631128 RepID=UPI00200D3D1D|nr:TauD/TfdA family dioxygenase [Frankia sp. AgPm24]MCK9921188.1 TauD/TfdA family dioxygenase [Frankia sp. AgPm24]
MAVNQDWRPLEVTPETADVEPSQRGLIDHLARAGDTGRLLEVAKAVVYRGFAVRPDALDSVLDHLLPERLAYVHGNSPRDRIGRNLYTSTEYPQNFTISLHNELSYTRSWPTRLLFYCEIPPTAGGATPVLDGQRWLSAIDPYVREAFTGGVRYTQNLHGGWGLGRSWQATFETDDRDVVETFLAGSGAQWWWRSDGGLRVTQVRDATVRHPVTGAQVWFNQADQWHVAGLGDETSAALAAIITEEDLPQSAEFADGSPIPAEYVAHVRDVGLANAVDVDWNAGDLLLIDNVLVAHGRRPFTGDRRVLVSMSGGSHGAAGDGR